jgi:sarcosine oxidase subunit beta
VAATSNRSTAPTRALSTRTPNSTTPRHPINRHYHHGVTHSVNHLDRLPDSCELVIVGGGVVGAATAFYAHAAGLRPLILEARAALCTLTTPASTGAYRLQFDNREELDLVRESVDLFLNFQDHTKQKAYDLNIRRQGYLWVTTEPARAARAARLVELQHSWGQDDIELLDGDQVREGWPYINPRVIAARWRGGDGFLDPKALTMGLVAGSGAGVVVSCRVTGFRIERGRVTGVQTTLGTVATENAVIAAGPLSGLVAENAGIELPITTVARQKIVMPECELVPPDAPMTIDDDTGAHWRPALRGAYLLFTDPNTPATPPTENVPPDHAAALRVLDPSSPVSVVRVAPFWTEVWARGAANWIIHAGQYTMTPDHRPLLGPSGVDGLWINTGYSGHGIMGGPAGSRHLIDVLTGRIAGEANAFRLDREFEPRDTDLL